MRSFFNRVWNGWSEVPTATLWAVIVWLVLDVLRDVIDDVFGEFNGAGVSGLFVLLSFTLLVRGWIVKSNDRVKW
jgi:hypothetical protein